MILKSSSITGSIGFVWAMVGGYSLNYEVRYSMVQLSSSGLSGDDSETILIVLGVDGSIIYIN